MSNFKSTDPVGPVESVGTLRWSALALLVALAAAVTAQGAFYPSDQRLIATPLAISVVLTVLKYRSLVVPWSLLATGGALSLWALLLGDKFGDGAGIAYMVAAFVAVVMVVASTARQERVALLGAVTALGVLLSLSGIVGVAFHMYELAIPGQGLWRASTTLTYANASGSLLGPIALVTLGRSNSEMGRSRVLWMSALVILFAGLGATLSRGGILAFGCGFLIILWRCDWRVIFSIMAPVLLGTAVALVGLGPSFPENADARPTLAIGALIVGLLLTLLVGRWSNSRIFAALGISVLIAALSLANGLGGETLSSLSDTRLSLESSDRTETWNAALETIGNSPWTGEGPGNGRLRYYQESGNYVEARFVHNEYLQIGVELGIVGMLLLAAIFMAIIRGVITRGVKIHGVNSPGVGYGVLAALLALAIGSGLDFLWHIPAIPLVGAVLIGASWQEKYERTKN